MSDRCSGTNRLSGPGNDSRREFLTSPPRESAGWGFDSLRGAPLSRCHREELSEWGFDDGSPGVQVRSGISTWARRGVAEPSSGRPGAGSDGSLDPTPPPQKYGPTRTISDIRPGQTAFAGSITQSSHRGVNRKVPHRLKSPSTSYGRRTGPAAQQLFHIGVMLSGQRAMAASVGAQRSDCQFCQQAVSRPSGIAG